MKRLGLETDGFLSHRIPFSNIEFLFGMDPYYVYAF